MAKREVYMSGMKARLVEWTARLDALKTKAGDHIQAEQQQQLDKWKAAAGAVADKLAELKATDEKWYLIKAEVERAGRAVEAALAQADPAASPAAEPKARQTA